MERRESILLSVVVPVYQAKDSLVKCVESIMRQNIDEMEVILVDDGSDDGSEILCDKLADKYKNVKAIHISNSGTYQARRTGVNISRGDVITFVDADDEVLLGAYEYLLDGYYQNNIDCLLYTYCYGDENIPICHCYKDGLYDIDRIQKEIIPTMIWDMTVGYRRLDPSLCCKFIRRELYLAVTKDVCYRLMLGEDAAVTYPMICKAKKIQICNKAFYRYCTSEKSSTRVYPLERVQELKNFKKVIIGKLEEASDFDFGLQIDCYLRMFINGMLYNWFECFRSSQMFTFPYKAVMPGEKIKLYGAGDVGKSYYATIKQTGYVCLCGWFDEKADILKSYNGEQIKDPSELFIDKGERVLVAVKDEIVFFSIRDSLIARGIKKERLIWEKPILIG